MKYIVLLFILLIIFSTTFAAEYIVPIKPASVDVADIDLDGDLDIVLGHDCHQGDYWGMITILKNNSYGEFSLVDTFSTFAYETSIQASKVNNNEYPDIISNDYNESIPSPVFTIINDYELYQWNYIVQFCYDYITISNYITYHSSIYDLVDIVFISHVNSLWGLLYNNGSGQFSSPEYYNLDYHPSGLACGDLNGDDREDILVSGGAYIDVWYNYSTGLQYCNISDTAYVSRIEIADIDQDRNNDIIATRWGMPGVPKRLFIYSNDGANNFYLSYSKWIYEAMSNIFISDLNNDNFPDVIYNVSYSYPNSNYELFHTYILFNNQDGTFQDPVNYYTGICSHKSYSADLDGNGWNDIITLNYDFVIQAKDFNLKVYPNPFNPSGAGHSPTTTISFSVTQNSDFVNLEIYNIKGQKNKNLIKQVLIKGDHSFCWDGRNNSGEEVSSGIYLCRLRIGDQIISKKLMMMK